MWIGGKPVIKDYVEIKAMANNLLIIQRDIKGNIVRVVGKTNSKK